MKKIFYLFTFLLITSCSNSDNTVDFNASSSDFVGTWNLTSYNTESSAKVNFQGQSNTTNSTSFGKDFDYTLTFSENPNEFTSEGNYTIVLEYDAGSGTKTDEYPVTAAEAFSNGTWSIEDNKIIFENGNLNAIDIGADLDLGVEAPINGITIKSISDDKIVLEELVSVDYSDTYFGEDISYEVDVKLTITLEK